MNYKKKYLKYKKKYLNELRSLRRGAQAGAPRATGPSQAPLHKLPDNPPTTSDQQSITKTSDNPSTTSAQQSITKTSDNSPTTPNDQSVTKTSNKPTDTSEGSPDDAQLDATHETQLNELLKNYFDTMEDFKKNIKTINIPLSRNNDSLQKKLEDVGFYTDKSNYVDVEILQDDFNEFLKSKVAENPEFKSEKQDLIRSISEYLEKAVEIKNVIKIKEKFNIDQEIKWGELTKNLTKIFDYLTTSSQYEELEYILPTLNKFRKASSDVIEFFKAKENDDSKYLEQIEQIDNLHKSSTQAVQAIQVQEVQEQLLLLQTQVDSLTTYIDENKPEQIIEKMKHIEERMKHIEDRLKTTDHEEFKRYVNIQLSQLRSICEDCSTKENKSGYCSIM